MRNLVEDYPTLMAFVGALLLWADPIVLSTPKLISVASLRFNYRDASQGRDGQSEGRQAESWLCHEANPEHGGLASSTRGLTPTGK